ncbi:MAG TPA: hypothetical protein VGM05_16175, partial [Planctomycetaceae bacterium]
DATHVEIDATAAGTTINGASSVVFALSTVSSITVNLGSGYDSYDISSNPGDPALNVGAGGITFQGAGGAGDDLEVFNNSANRMSIIGNVTVQGKTSGSALNESGSSGSELNLYTAGSGALTVSGSVRVSQNGTGSGGQLANIFTQGAGNLNILGTVVELSSQRSSGLQQNYVQTEGTGNITIGLGVTQTTANGQGGSENYILTASPAGGGNITIGSIAGGLTQTASDTDVIHNYAQIEYAGSIAISGDVTETGSSPAGAGIFNYLLTQGDGTISVGGGVTQAGTSAIYVNNDVYTFSNGNVSIGARSGGSITQTATSTGNVGVNNYIYAYEAGSLSVAAGIKQTGTTANFVNNDVFARSTGNVTVGWLAGGSIAQTATSTGSVGVNNYIATYGSGNLSAATAIVQTGSTSNSVNNFVFTDGSGNLLVGVGGITMNETDPGPGGDNYNEAYADSAGRLSTNGLITMNAANRSGPSDFTKNYVYTAGTSTGTLAALGIVINDSGPEKQYDYVYTDGAAINIGILGITISGSGTGHPDNEIFTAADNSPMTIAGSVTIFDSGSGHSYFDIRASANNSFITIGGNVTYDNHLNTTGHSFVQLYGNNDVTNSVLTIKGSLFVNFASTSGTASDNSGYSYNEVDLGEHNGTLAVTERGYGAVVNGVTNITGSNGQDSIYIEDAQLKLGATINTLGNPSPGPSWHDFLNIDGSAFGSTVLVVMSGPNAQININDGTGYQPTLFAGLFEAIMTGSNPLILVANSSGAGYSPVTFKALAIAIGNYGAGGLFEYHAANVMGSIVPVSFKVVVS